MTKKRLNVTTVCFAVSFLKVRIGKNKKAIAEYIRNQLQEDLAYERMSIKELVDPFTGEPVKASKK